MEQTRFKVMPKGHEGLTAIKWLDDGSNWREILAAMACPLHEEEGQPSCLLDGEGEEFFPGDWYIVELGESMSDFDFGERFSVVDEQGA